MKGKGQVLPSLVDASGAPLRRSAEMYRAGSAFSRELREWQPFPGSADSDLLQGLPLIMARTRDIAQNHGFASGAMQTHLDNVIGGNLRLSAKPEWRVLGQSPEWADEWGREVEAKFRLWAYDPRKFCDAARKCSLPGLFGLAYRSQFMNGAALALPQWIEHRGAPYATAIQLLEPDRLSNPLGQPDSDVMRGGVEIDEFGAAVAYHIRSRHPGDIFASAMGQSPFTWVRVPRETAWGRAQCIHAFDVERVEQTRGKPQMTAILEHLKMLTRYEAAELQATIVNAMFAAFIESPFDASLLGEALGAEDFMTYQNARADFHTERGLKMDGVKIPQLFPGEKFTFTTPTRPNTGFDAFTAAALRNIAAGTGLTYEQLSRDYSKTNYSSARAALLESWKFFRGKRQQFGFDFCTPTYALWLEEAVDKGEVTLPPGAPDFWEAYPAYTACKWIGPSMGWIDPMKEADAVARRLELNITTMEAECAAQGEDFDDVLQQRARELRRMRGLGLAPAGPAVPGATYASDAELAAK
ncbi:phage portal protein [Ferrovibrio xuzhouensis]|uniref:Phage portal protein n=1 Tax=Ferrovibrio xuzhouensis TaxID=1576914 RepID=A0ABV7VB20_9PROT